MKSTVATTFEGSDYEDENEEREVGGVQLPSLVELPKKNTIDFATLIESLKTLDPKYKTLWKLIYDNACADRTNAYIVWYDLFKFVSGDEEKHFKHGQTLTKYMERYEKANAQLLKLAELVEKVRETEEENSVMEPEDIYRTLDKD